MTNNKSQGQTMRNAGCGFKMMIFASHELAFDSNNK